MTRFVLILFLLFPVEIIHTQVYVDGGRTRHRFAQMNLGIDYRYFTGNKTESFSLSPQNELESFKLNNLHESRIIIGGTHFWGHADFFIAIPVVSLGKSNFKTQVETGAKVYPWRIENKKIRPYLGVSWMPSSYQQDEGANQWKSRYPIASGIVFNHKNHLIDFGFGSILNNNLIYFISETQSARIKAHSFWISLGYKFIFDTTLSAEKDWLSGRTQKLTDTLTSLKRLDGLTLALGPSSAFFSQPSRHNEVLAPFAGQHKAAPVFIEFGLGYYFNKPDIQFNLAYRTVKSEIQAYDFQQNIKRNALSFEAFKFLFDYHGFVPFLGPALSLESLQVNDLLSENSTSGKFTGVRPGITFGWDIRPNRLQSWYLRTNLRYFPNLIVEMPTGEKMRLDQLEFNFIQLVLFPGRLF